MVVLRRHDLPRALRPKKRNKYGAVKTKLDDYTFDSKMEARRYLRLKESQRLGDIGELAIHPKFDLRVNGQLIGTYTADFTYQDALGHVIVEDVKCKHTRTQAYKLRAKLLKALYGIQVEEIMP